MVHVEGLTYILYSGALSFNIFLLVGWPCIEREREQLIIWLCVYIYIYSMERERATYIDGHLFSSTINIVI